MLESGDRGASPHGSLRPTAEVKVLTMSERSNLASLEARLVKLEELLMHQQNWLGQLDAVVIDLQNAMARGHKQTALQIDRLRGMIDQRLSGAPPLDEKPPHY